MPGLDSEIELDAEVEGDPEQRLEKCSDRSEKGSRSEKEF